MYKYKKIDVLVIRQVSTKDHMTWMVVAGLVTISGFLHTKVFV